MLIDDSPYFTLKIRRGLSPEQFDEVRSALIKIAMDPPREQDEKRRVAIRALLNQYRGSPTARARLAAHNLSTYLSNAFPRERALEELPDPRSAERVLLHRIARLNDGKGLGARRLFDLANP